MFVSRRRPFDFAATAATRRANGQTQGSGGIPFVLSVARAKSKHEHGSYYMNCNLVSLRLTRNWHDRREYQSAMRHAQGSGQSLGFGLCRNLPTLFLSA